MLQQQMELCPKVEFSMRRDYCGGGYCCNVLLQLHAAMMYCNRRKQAIAYLNLLPPPGIAIAPSNWSRIPVLPSFLTSRNVLA